MATATQPTTVLEAEKDPDVEIIQNENLLFQTPSGTWVKRPLVGRSIPSELLSEERRLLARYTLSALRERDDKLSAIRLLNETTNSRVTDIVPAPAASKNTNGPTPKDEPPALPEESAGGDELLIATPRRKKWFGRSKSRLATAADIKLFMPIRYDFDAHPIDDRSNTWFVNAYTVLFDRITRFAREYFGFIDLGLHDFYQPWAVRMPREFYRYVEAIAEPDPATGGWDELLRSTDMRRNLIIGILVKIIEMKIFAEDLWGADERQTELLHSLDKAFVFGEGYSRQNLRAKTIRHVLEGQPITLAFHNDCTRLTAQVMLLLLPLFNYLSQLPPSTNMRAPDIKDAYQALHNIIAEAAYISIAMRLSPSIIHLAHVSPGTNYDPEEHTSLLDQHWTFSKSRVLEDWGDEHTNLLTEKASADGYKRGYERVGRQKTYAGRVAVERFDKAEKAVEAHRPPAQTHRAAVKIAVWPFIRRYSPGSGKAGGELDGQTIYPIAKAGAVFYYREQGRKVPKLEEHVFFKRREVYSHGTIRSLLQALITIIIVLGLAYFAGKFDFNHYQNVVGNFLHFPDYLTPFGPFFEPRGHGMYPY